MNFRAFLFKGVIAVYACFYGSCKDCYWTLWGLKRLHNGHGNSIKDPYLPGLYNENVAYYKYRSPEPYSNYSGPIISHIIRVDSPIPCYMGNSVFLG